MIRQRLIPLIVGCGVMGMAMAQAQKPDSRTAEITQAVSALKAVKPAKERKLLVFCVTRGYRHGSISTGQIAMRVMGEKTGAFTAVVSDDLDNFEPGKIDQFDAICFLNTTMEVFSPAKGALKKMSAAEKAAASERELRLKKSFMQFLKSGKGFVGIHSATDTFYQWEEYGDMIGGYFDGHPWGADTTVSVMVEKGQEKHACCAHLEGKNLDFKEEIYQFKAPYDPRKLHMLLRLDPDKTNLSIGKRSDKDYGVSWLKFHGQGRVFYCSLGHNHHIFSNPQVLQHYLSGIQWALGDLKVDVKIGE
ncbi:MAG: ThuA domain-containing protein [Akkermansiaceae bacterium]|nr:ThuA domain-containing protein [Akkermansiaceae bacterium]